MNTTDKAERLIKGAFAWNLKGPKLLPTARATCSSNTHVFWTVCKEVPQSEVGGKEDVFQPSDISPSHSSQLQELQSFVRLVILRALCTLYLPSYMHVCLCEHILGHKYMCVHTYAATNTQTCPVFLAMFSFPPFPPP